MSLSVTAYCLLPTAYCLLPTAYCLLHTAYCHLLRRAFANQGTSDYHTLYLIRTFVNLSDLRVTHEFFDGVVAAEPITTEQLHRIRGNSHRSVGGKNFGHRRDLRKVLYAGVDRACRGVNQMASRFNLGRHISQHKLNALK